MNKQSLLIVELCDNDYGEDLRTALEDLYLETDNIYNHSTDAIKQYIIAHIIGKTWKRAALEDRSFNEERDRWYLDQIHVTFRRELPRYTPDGEFVDHGGGSAGINLATGIAFNF